MSKKTKNKKPTLDNVESLTKEQVKEIEKHLAGMMEEATAVVKDYKAKPSELSEKSYVQVHEDSPFLDGYLKGDRWKRMVKPFAGMKEFLQNFTKKMDKKKLDSKKKK
tara:strand:+ start:75 stop:398 length:324 start_codon:yes stop_codon:yes gene_type:complete